MAAKTNVARILESVGAKFDFHTYECGGAISGVEVARAIGADERRVFKTLVVSGASGKFFVFVVPVARELDLKKAAAAVGEKSVSMIRQKELLPTTGYVHGGCSPVGMKKFFRTTLDLSAGEFERVIFSAGKIGAQVEISLAELSKAIKFSLADLTADGGR